jgi:hypothetical protein
MPAFTFINAMALQSINKTQRLVVLAQLTQNMSLCNTQLALTYH